MFLIKQKNSKIEYCNNIDKIKENLTKFDAVAFVGAGDINKEAENLLNCKNEKSNKFMHFFKKR